MKQRIADLEAELSRLRQSPAPADRTASFGLSDFEHAADGICVCHAIDTFPYVRFTFWNRKMTDLTGYRLEDINRSGWYQSLYPDPSIQAKAISRMDEMRKGQNLEAESWEISCADGERRILRISTSLLDDGDGTPRVMAIMHDVTERKQAEAALRREQQDLKREIARQSHSLQDAEAALEVSSERYRALFDIAGDALFVENDRDEILDVNQKACDLLGYSREELLTMKVPDIQAPECRGEAGCVLRDELTTHRGKPFEAIDLHKDGTRIPVEVTNTRLDKEGLFLSIVRDIRDRIAVEAARRETVEIIEKSPVAVFLWRNETNWPVEFVTRNVGRIFGHSDTDFLQGRILYSKVVHPDDLERVTDEVAAFSAESDRLTFTHQPYRILTKDGSVRWVNDQTYIRRDHAGKVTHYQGVVEDITEARRAADRLAAEKERLAVTLRSIGDAVITTDRRGRIVLMNPIAESLTGWTEAEAAGRPLMDVLRIVNERDGSTCPNPVDKVFSSGQTAEMAAHTMLIARDGREHVIADSGAPILNRQGEIIGMVLVFRDITGQQRIEKELLKMEKLKSLGVLAGGIAHDFNNFLTGIIGNLSLAKLDVESGHPVSRSLDEMEKAAMRAKDLTQQLLTFSKGGAPLRRTTSVGDLVRESAAFALHGSNVRCRFDIDRDLMPADVDDGQIVQVVHNLIINADQAMPNGGSVLIKGGNVTLLDDTPYALAPGEYIQLSFQDEGVGIHPDHVAKVFDPYFTTKQKGSGLGLAVAFNIIANHDGQLTVASTLGDGTTFTMVLPASTQSLGEETEKGQGLVTGSGRILVMDDEDFIRQLASVMLSKMGYEVALAKDGQEAVDMYKDALDAGRRFDAVILDLTVPGGMGGKEAMHRLSEVDPGVRAIVSSGYSNDPVMANFEDHGFCGAVKKPYLVEDMSQALHAVIQK